MLNLSYEEFYCETCDKELSVDNYEVDIKDSSIDTPVGVNVCYDAYCNHCGEFLRTIEEYWKN